jgi:hypothetical protein
MVLASKIKNSYVIRKAVVGLNVPADTTDHAPVSGGLYNDNIRVDERPAVISRPCYRRSDTFIVSVSLTHCLTDAALQQNICRCTQDAATG